MPDKVKKISKKREALILLVDGLWFWAANYWDYEATYEENLEEACKDFPKARKYSTNMSSEFTDIYSNDPEYMDWVQENDPKEKKKMCARIAKRIEKNVEKELRAGGSH